MQVTVGLTLPYRWALLTLLILFLDFAISIELKTNQNYFSLISPSHDEPRVNK